MITFAGKVTCNVRRTTPTNANTLYRDKRMKVITEKYTMQWFRKTTLKAVPEWGCLLFAAVVLFFAIPAQAQKVAVKNNLLITI